MKKLFILSFLSSLFAVCDAQELPVDATTNKVTYSDIVTATGQSKKQLFEKSKKWIVTKKTDLNPYSISMDNEQEGSVVGKGSFSLPLDRRKYQVMFTLTISVKDSKAKYAFSDFVIQFKTQAGSSSGGFSYWGGSSYHEAETLEYPIETFYPSRLHSKKPVIKWYEEIRKDAFVNIDREMQSLTISLKQSLTTQDNW